MTSQASTHARWPMLWVSLALVTLLAFGWLVYRPALGGTFLLDDATNLAGLSSVNDKNSSLQFILSGKGGPLGRPLALASFVPQAPAWGVNPEPFIRVNILIHLANGLLLYAFLLQLQLQLQRPPDNPAFVAIAGMALWLFMPLLASTSLLIVQRMTLMSATFILVGLNAYLYSRKRIARRPTSSVATMTVVLALATILATLSKENGVLLPALVLVIEATLLPRPSALKRTSWLVWTSIVLLVPTVLIGLFLIAQVPYTEADQLRRGFTAAERLLSQSRVLWEYLVNAFVPRPGNYGPFHDAHPVARSVLDPVTLAASVSWLLLVGGAIYWRRRYPIAAFAVLWYITGHMVESTILPLELYFEHRNYVPLIGPIFALSLATATCKHPLRTYAAGAIAVYLALLGFVLLGITSIWGQPQLAAQYWYKHNPASVRAATTFAMTQLSGNSPQGAVATLRAFAEQQPNHAYIRIPELNLACRLHPGADHSDPIKSLQERLPSVHFSYTTGSMLDELLTLAASGECGDVNISTVAGLASALLENRRYRGNDSYMQFHHKLLARAEKLSGNTSATLEQLSMAMHYRTDDDLTLMMVSTLVEAGRFDDARKFVETAGNQLPANPLRRYNSRIRLRELGEYVDAAERAAHPENEFDDDLQTEVD